MASDRSAADFFAERVNEYDSLIHRGAPRYGEMLDELVDCLPEGAENILELGCGTGALTSRIAGRWPEAKLTIVDAAQEMIDMTRGQIGRTRAALRGEIRFITSVFEDLDLRGEEFDCITSSMSLHHVVDKLALYANLRNWLAPGGRLALADELVGADAAVQGRFWDRWLGFAQAPGHLTSEEIEDIIEHMEAYDRYETLPRQMELLRNAGFETVDCVWRYLNYAVFVAS